jgi:hypothetical protein
LNRKAQPAIKVILAELLAHQNFAASSDFILNSNCGNRRCLQYVNAARLFPSVAGKFKAIIESGNLFPTCGEPQ